MIMCMMAAPARVLAGYSLRGRAFICMSGLNMSICPQFYGKLRGQDLVGVGREIPQCVGHCQPLLVCGEIQRSDWCVSHALVTCSSWGKWVNGNPRTRSFQTGGHLVTSLIVANSDHKVWRITEKSN